METECQPKSRFAEYYADPDYKSKHLMYMSQKVQCKLCGLEIIRHNATKHRATKKCQYIANIKTEAIRKVSQAINEVF
jgi:hypothetical protein